MRELQHITIDPTPKSVDPKKTGTRQKSQCSCFTTGLDFLQWSIHQTPEFAIGQIRRANLLSNGCLVVDLLGQFPS